jgi:hypothetical protein
LRGSAETNGRNSTNKGFAKLVPPYPRKLEAVISAKGASTKYSEKGLKTYVNVIFHFFIFNKCEKMYTNLFLLCHYVVL